MDSCLRLNDKFGSLSFAKEGLKGEFPFYHS